jgi:predicted AlkP superfamily phosphohydrolase/phosphomutase
MIDTGACADMISTIPPLTAPALAGFFTGLNPDNTGITGFLNRKGDLISFDDISHPTIWDHLSSAGIRSCVVGLRLTYPPRKIDGIMLSGGLLRSKGNDYIQPVEYLNRTYGFHPEPGTYPEMDRALKKGHMADPARLTDELIDLTRKQFAIFCDLEKSERFPFSLFWIENTDLLQHFCWHEPDQVMRLYECIDSLIADFLGTNPGNNLLIMSDHGFHDVPGISFNINSWLREQGYLRSARLTPAGMVRGAAKRVASLITAGMLPYTKRRLRMFTERILSRPDRIRQDRPVVPPLPACAVRDRFRVNEARAYAPVTWGISLGPDADDSREDSITELIARMQDFRDPDGNRVFTLISRKQDMYSGEYVGEMPDLLFLVDSRFQVETLVRRRSFTPYRHGQSTTGSHDQAYHGIMIAFGPDIDTSAASARIRIIDFLPTILSYFGVPYPAEIDGTSRAALFGVEQHDTSQAVSVESRTPDTRRDSAYTEEEEAEIRDRLEKLGYM